jgi:type I restriction enzyme S subunit
MEIIPLPPSEAVVNEYLFYALKRPAFIRYATAASHGLNMPRLGTEAAKNAPFPLAPLNEQGRIVEKLNTIFARVDTSRRRLGSVPAVLNRFRAAAISAATSGRLTQDWRDAHGLRAGYKPFHTGEDESFRGYEIPVSWEIDHLGNIASIVKGIVKEAKKQLPNYVEIPYLRVANVQRGYIDLTEIKTIRVPGDKLQDMLLQPGDILFNEGGDADKLGRGAVWEGQIERCTFQNHVFRARLDNPQFSPQFFSWFGNGRAFDFFLSSGKQSTNLASINTGDLAALPVPVPSVEEQAEIVGRIQSLFYYADRLEARWVRANEELDNIGPAVLDMAFRGELVPQDPTDEPASVLLDRVITAREQRAQQPKAARAPRLARKGPTYMTTLKEALAADGGWVTAEEAFRRCGWVVADTDRVEQLYAELRDLLRKGIIEAQGVTDEQGRKLTERLRLIVEDDHAA